MILKSQWVPPLQLASSHLNDSICRLQDIVHLLPSRWALQTRRFYRMACMLKSVKGVQLYALLSIHDHINDGT